MAILGIIMHYLEDHSVEHETHEKSVFFSSFFLLSPSSWLFLYSSDHTQRINITYIFLSLSNMQNKKARD